MFWYGSIDDRHIGELNSLLSKLGLTAKDGIYNENRRVYIKDDYIAELKTIAHDEHLKSIFNNDENDISKQPAVNKNVQFLKTSRNHTIEQTSTFTNDRFQYNADNTGILGLVKYVKNSNGTISVQKNQIYN